MSKFGFESINELGGVINSGFIDVIYYIDYFSVTTSGKKTYAPAILSNYILRAQIIGQNSSTRNALWKNSVTTSGDTVTWVVDPRFKTEISILVTLNVK